MPPSRVALAPPWASVLTSLPVRPPASTGVPSALWAWSRPPTSRGAAPSPVGSRSSRGGLRLSPLGSSRDHVSLSEAVRSRPFLAVSVASPAQASTRGVHDGRAENRTGPAEQGPRASTGTNCLPGRQVTARPFCQRAVPSIQSAVCCTGAPGLPGISFIGSHIPGTLSLPDNPTPSGKALLLTTAFSCPSLM